MTHTTTRTNGKISTSQLFQEVQRRQFRHWSGSHGCLRESFTHFQLCCFISGTEQCVVPNSRESGWQYVDQETTNELIRRQGHLLLSVVILVVSPLKRHHTIFQTHNTVIGNGHAVSIASEIFHNVSRVFEWWFAIDQPFLLVQKGHSILKLTLLLQMHDGAVKFKLGLLQKMQELAPEFP